MKHIGKVLTLVVLLVGAIALSMPDLTAKVNVSFGVGDSGYWGPGYHHRGYYRDSGYYHRPYYRTYYRPVYYRDYDYVYRGPYTECRYINGVRYCYYGDRVYRNGYYVEPRYYPAVYSGFGINLRF